MTDYSRRTKQMAIDNLLDGIEATSLRIRSIIGPMNGVGNDDLNKIIEETRLIEKSAIRVKELLEV